MTVQLATRNNIYKYNRIYSLKTTQQQQQQNMTMEFGLSNAYINIVTIVIKRNDGKTIIIIDDA